MFFVAYKMLNRGVNCWIHNKVMMNVEGEGLNIKLSELVSLKYVRL